MKIGILAIGDELMIGQVRDTNSGDIARMVEPKGWSLGEIRAIHDSAEQIKESVESLLESHDVVLTTGGLGPTKDDITKLTLMEIFGGELVHDEMVAANVRRIFERRGLHMNELTASQAMVPSSCRVLENEVGTAPIMVFERGGKMLVSMPGVPFETLHAMEVKVIPMLEERFGDGTDRERVTLIIHGITESDLAEKLDGIERMLGDGLHLAYLPQGGYLKLRIDGSGERAREVGRIKRMICEEIGDKVLWEKDATPEEIVKGLLERYGMRMGCAESCTGGNIAHRMTMLAGVSEVFQGGVVSYSNDVKMGVLGVKEETLRRYGAVSEETAREMAEGACRALGAEIAVATSGIAGPGGGSAEKPVGMVCMGLHIPWGTESRTFRFPGNRSRVIERASNEALLWMAREMKARMGRWS